MGHTTLPYRTEEFMAAEKNADPPFRWRYGSKREDHVDRVHGKEDRAKFADLPTSRVAGRAQLRAITRRKRQPPYEISGLARGQVRACAWRQERIA